MKINLPKIKDKYEKPRVLSVVEISNIINWICFIVVCNKNLRSLHESIFEFKMWVIIGIYLTVTRFCLLI